MAGRHLEVRSLMPLREFYFKSCAERAYLKFAPQSFSLWNIVDVANAL